MFTIIYASVWINICYLTCKHRDYEFIIFVFLYTDTYWRKYILMKLRKSVSKNAIQEIYYEPNNAMAACLRNLPQNCVFDYMLTDTEINVHRRNSSEFNIASRKLRQKRKYFLIWDTLGVSDVKAILFLKNCSSCQSVLLFYLLKYVLSINCEWLAFSWTIYI